LPSIGHICNKTGPIGFNPVI